MRHFSDDCNYEVERKEAKTANDLKIEELEGIMKAFMQEYKVQTEQAKDRALQEVWRVLNGQ